jgi:hypothetical protein
MTMIVIGPRNVQRILRDARDGKVNDRATALRLEWSLNEEEGDLLAAAYPSVTEITVAGYMQLPRGLGRKARVLILILRDKEDFQHVRDHVLQNVRGELLELRVRISRRERDDDDEDSDDALPFLAGVMVRRLVLSGESVRGSSWAAGIVGLVDLEVQSSWWLKSFGSFLKSVSDLKKLVAWNLHHEDQRPHPAAFPPEYSIFAYQGKYLDGGREYAATSSGILGFYAPEFPEDDSGANGMLVRSLAGAGGPARSLIFPTNLPKTSGDFDEDFGNEEIIELRRIAAMKDPQALLDYVKTVGSCYKLTHLYLGVLGEVRDATLIAREHWKLEEALKYLPRTRETLTVFFMNGPSSWEQTNMPRRYLQAYFRRFVVPRFEGYLGDRCTRYEDVDEEHRKSLARVRAALALLAARGARTGGPLAALLTDNIWNVAVRVPLPPPTFSEV